jgi:hypothetical protein
MQKLDRSPRRHGDHSDGVYLFAHGHASDNITGVRGVRPTDLYLFDPESEVWCFIRDAARWIHLI